MLMLQGGSRQYPAVMLATGDHDDRVVPLHSYKLVAELQHQLAQAQPEASAQRNPLLIRIEVRTYPGSVLCASECGAVCLWVRAPGHLLAQAQQPETSIQRKIFSFAWGTYFCVVKVMN